MATSAEGAGAGGVTGGVTSQVGPPVDEADKALSVVLVTAGGPAMTSISCHAPPEHTSTLNIEEVPATGPPIGTDPQISELPAQLTVVAMVVPSEVKVVPEIAPLYTVVATIIASAPKAGMFVDVLPLSVNVPASSKVAEPVPDPEPGVGGAGGGARTISIPITAFQSMLLPVVAARVLWLSNNPVDSIADVRASFFILLFPWV
ncbi:MAG: hypothetical protein V7746_13360 [Halioglobus sp.]